MSEVEKNSETANETIEGQPDKALEFSFLKGGENVVAPKEVRSRGGASWVSRTVHRDKRQKGGQSHYAPTARSFPVRLNSLGLYLREVLSTN